MKASFPPTLCGIGTLPRQLQVERVGLKSWQVSDSIARTAIAVLEVIPLDGSRWRISDSMVNERDPCWLLGYVERLEHDKYEVLWLAAPVTWAFVASFEDALAAVADRTQVTGAIQAQHDPAIAASSTVVSSHLAFDHIRRRQQASTTAY
ncbi:hypothetical protein GCM10007382_23800 [Salinibacterium xinjiangense]|nr:hypothetical protein GCM10007382_23800 [Salinibacterium xinjiangense]